MNAWDIGIIPACAGSTPRKGEVLGGEWDHPRLRGEHSVVSVIDLSFRGSSPPARGAPALPLRQTRVRRDHPRLRGEH